MGDRQTWTDKTDAEGMKLDGANKGHGPQDTDKTLLQN